MTNYELAARWSSQAKPYGQNRSMNYAGDTIRSYSTPIARIVRNLDGRPAVLLTERSHSATTATKHKPAVIRAAIGRGMPTFAVPDPTATPAENWETLFVRFDRLGREADAARSRPSRDKRRRDLDYEVFRANDMAAFFGLELFPRSSRPELIAS